MCSSDLSAIRSCSGSARVPSVRTTTPFTVTRPARMSASAWRREATPAALKIFCRRSGSGYTPEGGGDSSVTSTPSGATLTSVAASSAAPSPRSRSGGSAFRSGRPKTSRNSRVVA